MFRYQVYFAIAVLSGATFAYPAVYSQPQYVHHVAPQQQYAPVQYQAVPVQSHGVPSAVQYQSLQQPHYQSAPVTYAAPSVHQSTAGASHGAYGQQSSGSNSHAAGQYADSAAHSGRAHQAHGQHNTGAYQAHGVQGAKSNNQDTYRNVGSYSSDTGSGFEKSYSFDRAMGYHDIDAHNAAQSSEYASKDKQGHHNVGAHSTELREKQGAHAKEGSQSHSSEGYNKSLFEKYGYTNNSGKQQGYSYSPVYGYGYH
ncbi:hypothetical protein AVEN_46224-1 [Araneus ventricosus]|uniref:Uncharacterized protein n=1 Tax=Araneus ventricosus TaxID=182803 RepID=A0A4Y2J6Q4_ARAVE|nr:hypothetical protein AVEN_46224-1 [Araneus ventricosus]